MDAEQCVAFLKALHCQKIRIKDNGWVEACCPLAQWTHEHGVDHSPSFGLSITPGERSRYSCFACRSGSVEELLQTLEMYHAGKHGQFDFKLCHQLLDAEPQLLPLPEYGTPAHSAEVFVEWPQYWLNSFQFVIESMSGAVEYLASRGVTAETCFKYDLRYDSKRHMIVCPYWDVFGRLAGARGRSILPETEGPLKHFDYSFQGHNNCRLVWYNEKVLNLYGPVVVVEGQFDCWRTLHAYPKVVANLTAKPSYEKMKKLSDSPMVIQIPDNDKTGQLSVEVYSKYCKQLGIPYKVIWLDDGAKDPDECHPDYLKDKIEAVL